MQLNAKVPSASLVDHTGTLGREEQSRSSPTMHGDVPVSPARTAIFVIHGISPIQRYAVQDQFADGFLRYLQGHAGAWSRAIHWPKNSADADITPSAIRIYDASEDAGPDTSPRTFDIFEGYWSPLSKGKTSFASLLQWLFNITFLASSSTADLPCKLEKVWWDVRYLGGLLLLFGGLSIGAVAAAAGSWRAFTHLQGSTDDSVPWSVSAIVSAALKLKPESAVLLALVAGLGYCVTQLWSIGRVRRAEKQRTSRLSAAVGVKPDGHFHDRTVRAAKWHQLTWKIFLGATIATGLLTLIFIGWEAARGVFHAWPASLLAVGVVAAFVAVQVARFVANFAVENVLGDVQVYTTHDTTAQFFTIRNQIIDTVARALLGILKAYDEADKTKPLYDSIHIAAHSLGSTIGLDVLMRMRMLVEEESVELDEFNRIASFVTFGTALEKTRFLCDVAKPTLSAAHDQWDADVFGRFFSDNPAGEAIYWKNMWYFHDIVANEIESYKSDVDAGSSDFTPKDEPHPICDNTRLHPQRPAEFWRFVHGDYLGDETFWDHAGPIFTRTRPIFTRTLPAQNSVAAASGSVARAEKTRRIQLDRRGVAHYDGPT